MTARYGHPPRVSMILAFSFGFYGLLRKKVPATGVQGLTAETLLLTPVALVWLGWRARQGDLVFGGGDPRLDVLLPAAGLITALPLIWFAEGARRLRLATMGFMHYLAPTGQFLLAVFAFGEPFGADRLVGFLLIWAALGLYTWDTLRGMRPGLDPPGRM
jgi:chloramphenicol-sensitive protein RarD